MDRAILMINIMHLYNIALQVRTKYPDGTPASNIKIKIKVTDDNYKELFLETVISKGGQAKVNLPEIGFDVKRLRFTAKYVRESLQGSLIRDYLLTSSAYHTANAWYSPSHSYLGISSKAGVYKVGSNAKINVKYTTVDNEKKTRNVYYSLVCKGVVALASSFETEFAAAISRQVSEARTPMTTPETTTQEVPRPEMTTPEMTSQEVPGPEMTTPEMTSQEVLGPEMTTPEMTSREAPTPEMTTPETTTQEVPGPKMTTPEMTTTTPRLILEDSLDFIYPYPYWMRNTDEPVTRPPLPRQFSTGSFDVNFKVTEEMSPSCRMLVYYIRDKETVADNVVLDVEDSFQNKVSLLIIVAELQKNSFPGNGETLSA